MTENDKSIIEAFLQIMPFFSQCFEDIVITLSDNKNYLYYKPGTKLDHGIRPGDPVKQGSMTDRAFKKKGFVMANVGAEVFGVAYSAFGFPIFNAKHEIIGGMVFCESIEMQENRNKLKSISEEIYRNMNIMGNNINLLTNKSKDINATSQILLGEAKKSEEQLQETNHILNIIKSVAHKTNILGINASIESTRVGKEGAGFKIVADEIRNLSLNTDDAIKKIEPIIEQIHLNSDNMTSKIQEINQNLGSIAEFITEARQMSEKLSLSSKMIDELADNLVKSSRKSED